MPNSSLPPRLAAIIRLALLTEAQSPEELIRSERLGQAAGLTGAEIDAARQGRSFDVRASGAIALARAVACGDAAKITQDRLQASASGLKAAEIHAVELEARRVAQGAEKP